VGGTRPPARGRISKPTIHRLRSSEASGSSLLVVGPRWEAARPFRPATVRLNGTTDTDSDPRFRGGSNPGNRCDVRSWRVRLELVVECECREFFVHQMKLVSDVLTVLDRRRHTVPAELLIRKLEMRE